MPRINLLDWRQERRERRKKKFISALVFAALGAVALVLVGMWAVDGEIEYQNARNRYLQDQIRIVENQMREIKGLEETRARLIARMRVIEKLQQNRARIVHFFDQIVATLPEGVYLTSLKQDGAKTTLQGIADSNGRVSTYLKNLDGSPWFTDPRLIVINAKNIEGRRVSDFTLEVKSAAPEGDDAAGDTVKTAVNAGKQRQAG